MAEKRPVVRARQVLRALQRDGWLIRDRSGSHVILVHPTKRGHVSVPVHRGETVAPGTLRNILQQAGLTATEFQRLL